MKVPDWREYKANRDSLSLLLEQNICIINSAWRISNRAGIDPRHFQFNLGGDAMGTFKFIERVIYLFLLLAFAGIGARAQFTSGIEGTVTDPTGAVVPGASVMIKNVETGITNTVQTSAAGSYRFTALSAAVYTLTVSAHGFKTTIQPAFPVQITEIKTVNVLLEVGPTTTQVTVSATTPA